MDALGNLPAATRRTLLEIGAAWGSDIQRHREIVLDAYRPLLARAPKAGVELTRNIAYGSHPRQIADIYRPAGTVRAPVIIFVHGGAFVRGDKNLDEEVYANVLYYFARHGYVGVNLEYRLAPEFKYPSGAQDVAAAVEWVKRQAREFGGDPASVFLVGHSAGGTHVATYAYDPVMSSPPDASVKGIVLISARLRADVLPGNPNAGPVRAYFGDDPSRYEQRSPVTHAARSTLPVFIAIAEYENPYLDVHGVEFLYRVAAARGRAPRFLRLPRHNHISIAAHLNTEEDLLGAEIRDFFATEC